MDCVAITEYYRHYCLDRDEQTTQWLFQFYARVTEMQNGTHRCCVACYTLLEFGDSPKPKDAILKGLLDAKLANLLRLTERIVIKDRLPMPIADEILEYLAPELLYMPLFS